MKAIVHFEPLTPDKFTTYITVGTKAYNQHYRHLWPKEDTSPYIQGSFTEEILLGEKQDSNTNLFLIHYNKTTIGILKLTLKKALGAYSEEDALYVDKIYLQKEATGKGIGKKVLQFIQLRAKELKKKLIWLDTMQKGPALHFYLSNGFKKYGTTKVPFPQVIEAEKPMFIMIKELSENDLA